MNSVIDERVVQMAFDNSRFEKNVSTSISTLDKLKSALKLDGFTDGLSSIERSASRLDLSGIGSAVDKISDRFSAFGILGMTVLQNLAQKAYETGERIVKSLTIDQISAGWDKYAEKTTAVQTIMAATADTWKRDANAVQQASAMIEHGVDPQRAYEYAYAMQKVSDDVMSVDEAAKSLGLTVGQFNELLEINADYIGDNFAYAGSQMDYVNGQMEKLNWFTDETSYNFTDMASNIGKFTANNIPLSQATTAMEGIATWAAASGQNAGEASRAMYNMAQAIGVGSVKLQDWKSIENANMATAKFKQTVLDSAVAMGTLKKQADGTFKTLKGTQVTVENFSQTLSEGWFSKDVLMDTLNNYGQFTDQLYNLSEASELTASDILELVEAQKKNQLSDELLASKMGDCAISADELRSKVQELASDTNALGYESFKAAQEAKTYRDAIDATGDAASTQWMNIFENIFGSYERARHVWTGFAEFLYDTLVSPLEKIREVSEGFIAPFDNIGNVLRKQAAGAKTSTDRMLDYAIAMREGTMTTDDFAAAARELGLKDVNELTDRVEVLASDIYGDFIDALSVSSKEMGISSSKMLDLVNAYKDGLLRQEDLEQQAQELNVSLEDLTSTLDGLVEVGNTSGLDRIVSGLKGIKNVLFDIEYLKTGETIQHGIIGSLIEGFQSIIPPMEITRETVYGLTKRFQEFGESLKISESFELRLTKAGEGLAKIMQFVGNTISNLWQQTFPLRLSLEHLAKTIIGLVTDIFGLASDMDSAGLKGETFGKICNWISSIIFTLSRNIRYLGLEKFQQVLSVAGKVLSFIGESLKTIWEVTQPLRSALANIIGAVGNLVSKLLSLGDGMEVSGIKGDLLKKVCEILADIINKVADVIKNVDFDSLKTKFAGVTTVFEGLKKVFNWLFEKISNFNLGDALGKAIDYIKEKFEALKEFLSGVDWGNVLKVSLTGGISAFFGAKIFKLFKSGSSVIETLADLKEKVTDVFDGITNALNSFSKRVNTESLQTIATAILELSLSLLVLGFVNYDNAIYGVMAIGAIMAGLMVVMNSLGKIDKVKMATVAASMLSAAAALLVLAVSLAVLAGVVALFTLVSRMDGLEKGLAVLAGVLIGVVAALVVMSELSPKVLVSAAALIVLAGALIVLAGAIALFTLVAGMDNISKGIALFVGALLLAIAALTVMSELSPKVLVSAVSLLVLSAAMIVLAGALAAFTAIAGKDNAWTGVALLVATLGALTIALIALGATGPVVIVGAAALLVGAAACIALAAAVGIVSAVLPALGEGLAALSDGIGRGVTSIGEGVENFLTSLSNSITAAGVAIGNLVKSIGQGIGDAISAFGEGFGSAVESIGSGIGGAIQSLGEGVATAISDIIASVGEGISRGITSISDAIGTFGNSLTQASIGITALGTAIRSLEGIKWTATAVGIGEFALALKKLKVDKKMASDLNEVAVSVVTACSSIVQAVDKSTPNISVAASNLITAFINGINSSMQGVYTSASDVGSYAAKAVTAYNENWSILGANVSIGFANGIYSQIGEVTKAVSAMANSATKTIQISIDAHSPSRLTEKLGGYFGQGFANGILSEISNVENASGDMVNGSIGMIEQAKNLIAGVLQDDFTPVITPVVDMSNVDLASEQINSTLSNSKIGLSGELSGAVASRLASNVGATGQTINNNTGDTLNNTINIYAAEGMDENAIADAVMERMGSLYARRGVAFG